MHTHARTKHHAHSHTHTRARARARAPKFAPSRSHTHARTRTHGRFGASCPPWASLIQPHSTTLTPVTRAGSGFSGSFVSGFPTARLGFTLRRGHEGTEHLSTKGTWVLPLTGLVCLPVHAGHLETIGEPAGAWLGKGALSRQLERHTPPNRNLKSAPAWLPELDWWQRTWCAASKRASSVRPGHVRGSVVSRAARCEQPAPAAFPPRVACCGTCGPGACLQRATSGQTAEARMGLSGNGPSGIGPKWDWA